MAKAKRIEDLWEKLTLESQMAKIRDPQMRNMLSELRKLILNISDKIEERVTKSHLIFRTSKNFARIYFQPRGFWLDVRLSKNEFNANGLDARPERNPN